MINQSTTKTIIEPVQAVQRIDLQSIRKSNQKAFEKAAEALAKVSSGSVKGEYSDYVRLATTQLRKAQKLHFNSIALGLAKFLQTYYQSILLDKKNGRKYQLIREKYLALASLEDEIDCKFLSLSTQINSTLRPNKLLLQQIEDFCDLYKESMLIESAPIKVRLYIINIALAGFKNDYSRIIELCNEIIDWLEIRRFGWVSGFYSYLVNALMVSNKYDQAQKAARKAVNNSKKGGLNWSAFVIQSIELELHFGNYKAAFQIFSKHQKSRHINKALSERWSVIQGYLKFLSICGELDIDYQFKLGKMINESTLSSADKTGNNINVVILSIILNIKKGKAWIIDHVEAIDRYNRRYLKNDDRSKKMLQVLCDLVRCDFTARNWTIRNEAKMNSIVRNKRAFNDIDILPFNDILRLIPLLLK